MTPAATAEVSRFRSCSCSYSTRSRAFHEGCSAALLDYYRRVYERKFGEYAGLLSPAERTSVLETS
jgi:hypothetical protein